MATHRVRTMRELWEQYGNLSDSVETTVLIRGFQNEINNEVPSTQSEMRTLFASVREVLLDTLNQGLRNQRVEADVIGAITVIGRLLESDPWPRDRTCKRHSGMIAGCLAGCG